MGKNFFVIRLLGMQNYFRVEAVSLGGKVVWLGRMTILSHLKSTILLIISFLDRELLIPDIIPHLGRQYNSSDLYLIVSDSFSIRKGPERQTAVSLFPALVNTGEQISFS